MFDPGPSKSPLSIHEASSLLGRGFESAECLLRRSRLHYHSELRSSKSGDFKLTNVRNRIGATNKKKWSNIHTTLEISLILQTKVTKNCYSRQCGQGFTNNVTHVKKPCPHWRL